MSPILVRPVREQLEHDRVIRLLQAKYKRKYNAAINPGGEQTAPVGDPAAPQFPDLVLTAPGRGKRILGVVEVETSESVTSMEAMAQWALYGRLSAEFVLYVPVGSVDAARRLCAEHGIEVAEIWTYHMLGDQLRFTEVYRASDKRPAARSAGGSAPKPPSAPPVGRAKTRPTRVKARPAAARIRPMAAAAKKKTPPRPAIRPAPKKKLRPRSVAPVRKSAAKAKPAAATKAGSRKK